MCVSGLINQVFFFLPHPGGSGHAFVIRPAVPWQKINTASRTQGDARWNAKASHVGCAQTVLIYGEEIPRERLHTQTSLFLVGGVGQRPGGPQATSGSVGSFG